MEEEAQLIRNMSPSPGFEMDDQNDAFYNPREESVYDAFGPTGAEIDRKFRAIEEKMKVMEGSNAFGLDAAEMCLVSGVQIPTKFKVTSFEKYKGSAVPERTSEHTVGKWLLILMMRSYSCTSSKTA